MIRPPVGSGRNGMAAMEILAVNEDAAYASVAHLSKGDFLWARGMRPLKRELATAQFLHGTGAWSRMGFGLVSPEPAFSKSRFVLGISTGLSPLVFQNPLGKSAVRENSQSPR
jgi:hypothetical protein